MNDVNPPMPPRPDTPALLEDIEGQVDVRLGEITDAALGELDVSDAAALRSRGELLVFIAGALEDLDAAQAQGRDVVLALVKPSPGFVERVAPLVEVGNRMVALADPRVARTVVGCPTLFDPEQVRLICAHPELAELWCELTSPVASTQAFDVARTALEL